MSADASRLTLTQRCRVYHIYIKIKDFTVWRLVLSRSRCSLTVFISPPETFRPKISVLVNPSVVRWLVKGCFSGVFISIAFDIITTQKIKPCLREWVSVTYSRNCWLICLICVGKDSYRYFLWHVRKNSSLKNNPCSMMSQFEIIRLKSICSLSLCAVDINWLLFKEKKKNYQNSQRSLSFSCYSVYLHTMTVAGV